MKRKAIIFILDGLGDRPCAEFDGQTPLQAANSPVLDALAANGQCGLVDPIAPGVRVETHTGVSALMGLKPKDSVSIMRGPVEGAGVGVDMLPGDVAMRFNFATVEQDDEGGSLLLRDRRAGRISADTDVLCEALNTLSNNEEGPLIRAYPATHYRGVLLVRSTVLSGDISSNDPGEKGVGGVVSPVHVSGTQTEASNTTAEVLNDYLRQAYELLDRHPVNQQRRAAGKPVANYLLVRGAGRYHQYDSLLNQHGLRTAVVAGECTVLGLARMFGFSTVVEACFTATYDTDITAKLKATEKALSDHDIVYAHFKATDIASHDRQPKLKADFITAFDEALSKFDLGQYVVAVCADHSTDCVRGEHNADPVPVILNYPDSRIDKVTEYNEIACVDGSLGRLSGQHFVASILDAMDRIVAI